MDDIRVAKSSRRRKPLLVEGMLAPGKADRPRVGALPSHKLPKNTPTQTKSRLDQFDAREGFHPVSQPKMRAEAQPFAKSKVGGRSPKRDAKGRIDMSLPPAGSSKKVKKQHHWIKRSLKTAGALTMIVVLVFGLVIGRGLWKAKHIFKGGGDNAVALQANLDPTKLKGEGDGRVNIMLLGVGGKGHEAPDLTDTILIASIDPLNHKASLLSIPRDLYVKMPSNNFIGGYQKINAAYEAGKYSYLGKQDDSNANAAAVKAGFASIDQVVEQVLGIPIHYHVLVNFQAFRQAIDTVGGVTIDVPEQLYDPYVAWENNNNPIIAKAGLQTFNGKQALLYTRSRQTSSDFARTQRQRSVIIGLKDKVLSAGTLSNPQKLNGLFNAFGDNVFTDMTTGEANRMYEIGKQIGNSSIVSVGLADPPNNYVTTGNVNGLSVVIPTAGQFVYTDIQNFVRNTLKDGYIANENSNITILNGTSIGGLATTKSTELKSYGYNVTLVGDAPTRAYQKTVIVDMTKGVDKYTKSYLEKRFKVTATTKLPDATIVPGTADFVIILGTDASTTQ